MLSPSVSCHPGSNQGTPVSGMVIAANAVEAVFHRLHLLPILKKDTTMTTNQYQRSQRRHRTAEIAVETAQQCGVCLREFIRTALPKLDTAQLLGVRRVLDGILKSRGITSCV